MGNKISRLDKIIDVLMIFLYSALFLFEEQKGGRYIILFLYFTVFVLILIRKRGKISFSIQGWHLSILILAFYSLISSLWAINPDDSMQKFITLMQILILNSILYIYFQSNDNIYRLYKIIKWGGYFICIFSINSYGANTIINSLLQGVRLENGYNNVNVIGIVAATSIIIELYETKYYKCLKKSSIFLIPAFIMVLTTQSKKAFILLILGVYFIFNFSKKRTNKILDKIFLVIINFIIFILLGILISKLSIFDGIKERFLLLLNTSGGENQIGSSSYIRKQMIELGWNSFLENPILGIGIGCPHFLANREIGYDAYLHNNYIELLCGGGIIGFVLYYSIYIYLIKNLYKYRSIEYYGKNISILIIILILIMDYGMVSSYSKETYFHFMVLFLCIRQLKAKDKNLKTKSEFKNQKEINYGK